MDSYNLSDRTGVGEKALRLLRPSVVVLCGPAGSGKTTFAKLHFRPTQIISSDWARGLVCDDERDQRYNTQAFAVVHFLIDQRLRVNRLCVVDSTALAVQSRRDLVSLARKRQVPVTLILFDLPLQTCIERDEKRERSVGRSVVERHYQAFEESKVAVWQEGFDQVLEFHEGDAEKAKIEILFRPVAPAVPHPQGPNAGPPRKFPRPAPTFGTRPGKSGQEADGAAQASEPPPSQHVQLTDTIAALDSKLKSESAAGKAPELGTNARPHSPSPLYAAANKTSAPPVAAASPKPAPPAAQRAAWAGSKTEGGS
jgi:predicted kinase